MGASASKPQGFVRMSHVEKLSDDEREKILQSICPIHTRTLIFDPNEHKEEMPHVEIPREENKNVIPQKAENFLDYCEKVASIENENTITEESSSTNQTAQEAPKHEPLPNTPSDRIRVLQYNVLADCYTDSSRYSYCETNALSWEGYRKYNIAKEILHVNPDIITLQEVDNSKWFDTVFNSYGYDGLYSRRPGGHADGLGLYFKKDKFEFKQVECISFNQLIQLPVPPKNIFEETRYKTNNIACLALLKHKESGNEIAVVTTHIYWDPKLSDLKVMQSHQLLLQVEDFLKSKTSKGMQTPVIVTGDFNSMPNSAVYELYSKGVVSGKHRDLLNNKSEKDFTHNFKLKSSYVTLNEPATNVTPSFTETLDYIWYSEETLQLKAVLDIFDKKEYFKHTALPSVLWSSDHISLAAEFTFAEPK